MYDNKGLRHSILYFTRRKILRRRIINKPILSNKYTYSTGLAYIPSITLSRLIGVFLPLVSPPSVIALVLLTI